MNRRFDRVLLARHFALSAAAVAAFAFRSEFETGYVALWIVGVSATLNFIAYLFQSQPSMARFAQRASPLIGLASWSALAAVTNGVTSPFITGFWLEIVLSAVSLKLRGVAEVTVLSLFGIVAAQAWVGFEGAWVRLVLQLGFTGAMGTLTYFLARRWLRTQEKLDAQRSELDDRLVKLNQRLEDDRAVAELGENVARLAHGLKNAVHSLRGFVRLIEPKVQGQSGVGPAMEGLSHAIDDLESLAHLTLGSAPAPASSPAPDTAPDAASADGDAPAQKPATVSPASPREVTSGSAIERVVDAASRNVAAGHAAFSVDSSFDAQLPSTALADKSLEEVLIILLRNAAEAMDGQGQARITVGSVDGGLCLVLRDEGPGFGGADPGEIFKPGYTTKEGGSGYGLFLARRILEEHGGRLDLSSGAERGAIVTLWLPAAHESGGA